MLLLTLLLLPLGIGAQSINRTALQELEDALYKGFADVWPFIKSFPEVSDLRVQRSDLYQGIANQGPWTEYSLQGIINKILNQKKIRVLIVGESISAGANLGCRNNRRTFHYGLAMWWIKAITAATGSRLTRHQIAVGGVATNYFDRCWKEYLYKNETFDLVLWEFAFNDAEARLQSKSIERFTRSVANLDDIPGLIFVSFFRKNFFEQYTSRNDPNPCDKIRDEINRRHDPHEIHIANVASYYGVTLIDLERTACSALDRNSTILSMQHMFSIDHPSFLAHAQMTYILIHYLRATFAGIVKKMKNNLKIGRGNNNKTDKGFKRKLPAPEFNHRRKILPQPIYLTQNEININDKPICWTAVLPNIHIKPQHDLFDLKVKYSKHFKKLEKTDWREADEKRYDVTGGFYTTKKNETIKFEFLLPPERPKWRVAIAIRNKFYGGNIEVSLRTRTNHTQSGRREEIELSKDIINSSTQEYSGVNVYDLSKKVSAGKKTLFIKTVTGGVHICGIIAS